MQTHAHTAELRGQPQPARWSRRRTPLLIVALVIAAGAFAGAFAVARDDDAAPASPASDLPRKVGGALEVSPSFRELAGIETVVVSRGPLTPLVKVVGTATFDPTHVAAVGTRASGIVTKVFHVEGDFVQKGDVLAEIESPTLATAQAELRVATAKKRAAMLNEDREERLFEKQLTTAREYEQAVAALSEEQALASAAADRVKTLGGGGAMGLSQLRAPVAGLVAERSVAPGQSVGPSLVAFRVGDLDQLWVLLRVFEGHVQLMRVGDEAVIRTLSDPPKEIHGKVAHVGSVIDPATRTADVRVEVSNEERVLRAGQAVEATTRASGPAHVALSVPTTALTYVDGAPTVFVAETPTRFVVRKVELGLDGGDRVEIVKGVSEGEAVVSRSVLALKSELFR
jgi:cobalt-zinc-cadmium efflux system membrane fusion protein